ncbi:MAG: PQQ-binding-like beta-propeller repeat protein [Verrucomicrobiota bacterium]
MSYSQFSFLRMITLLATLFPVAFIPAAKAETNWGQWRGPSGTGAAPESVKPPVEWSEEKNVKWKVPIPGDGTSTPIIWEDKIFIQTAMKASEAKDQAAAEIRTGEFGEPSTFFVQADAQDPRRSGKGKGKGRRGGKGGGGGGAPTDAYDFMILCLDRKDGTTIWSKTAASTIPHEGTHQNHSYGSHTPATDGEYVFAYFGSRGLFCYDMDGELVWEKQFGEMTMRAGFGEGTSLALHGDKVIVNWDHEGPSFIAAFDKKTGKEIWLQERDEASTWSSPLVVETGDGKAQVVTNGEKAVRSYDAGTGELIWTSTGQTARPVATPVSDGKNVFVMSGFRGNMLSAVKLSAAKGDVSEKEAEIWTLDRNTPDIASPVLSDGRLYFTTGKGSYMSAYRAATGEPLFVQERIDGLRDMYASPAAANGHVYIVGRDGATFVIKDSDQLELVATNRLDDQIDGSPAFSGKDLFLRGRKYLYCLSKE